MPYAAPCSIAAIAFLSRAILSVQSEFIRSLAYSSASFSASYSGTQSSAAALGVGAQPALPALRCLDPAEGAAHVGDLGMTEVEEHFRILHEELDVSRAFCGHTNLQNVDRSILLPGTYPTA